MQPFTCNSAINPIIWSGYKPKYIDIKKSNLSIDPELLRKSIGEDKSIRVVIVQHTFGVPGEIEEIGEICRENGVILIEDCAHALGTNLNDQPLGTYGDVSFLSFGLEKNLPTKVGGALLVNNEKFKSGVDEIYDSYAEVTLPRTILWLKNPFIRIVARKTGRFGVELIDLLKKLTMFEVGFSDEEMDGGMPKRYPKKMSNPIASIVLGYFDEIGSIAHKRKYDSIYYDRSFKALGFNDNINPLVYPQEASREVGHSTDQVDESEGTDNNYPIDTISPYLKYPFFAKDQNERDLLKNVLEEKGFYISNWYDHPIYPQETELDALAYEVGSCPVAEIASETVINLPTGDPFDERIIDFVVKFYNRK